MKRWNGWGNVATDYPLPAPAEAYLTEKLGTLSPRPDATLSDILPAVPGARLPEHRLLRTDPETRLRHTRGQSLPDWVALRYGLVDSFPDGVAFPESESDVAELLLYAQNAGASVIPYGGGTSVVGHINPAKSNVPVLTLSLERMNRLLALDETSRLATFQAGVVGPQLESQLNVRGYTLGHFPQSFEYSTLGGWIAARSSGQQSLRYGRIEQMFAGGRMETPRGRLELPVFPASAAGPDLREMVLGSEGRLGVVTQATVRVRPRPKTESFHGVFFRSWEQGVAATRYIIQNHLPVSMLRLSNPLETDVTLRLSGKGWLQAAKRGLWLLGFGETRCLLIFGVTDAPVGPLAAMCRAFGGLVVGTLAGHTWQKNRFLSPYLRNTLWERGVAVDTLETALPWSQVEAAAAAIPTAIEEASQAHGERVLAFAHLSHLYRDGASIYVTYLFRRAADPDELLERWSAMKAAASRVLQSHGGTISHQHGIGTDHAPCLPAEKSALGMDAIRALCQSFDPQGMMNPGKLLGEVKKQDGLRIS